MVAAIVLVALGMKSTLAHVGDPLEWETATALVGGAALYLLAHVAFKLREPRHVQRAAARRRGRARWRSSRSAHEVDALVTVAVVAAVLWRLIAFETVRYAETRAEVRHAE